MKKIYFLIFSIFLLNSCSNNIINETDNIIINETGSLDKNTKCQEGIETPYIDKVVEKVGLLEIYGCNFNGFEGDLDLWIENTDGKKAILYAEKTLLIQI